jgi:short subunit dehydrogenase-like uncharacterized protein
MFATGTKTRLLLYGAYGYTGRLTAELAAAKEFAVVLGGRNKEALTGLGDRLGLPTRVVGLNDPGQLSDALKDIACVAHLAGPFAITSAPMLSACLATQANYIDITGEIEVFEAMWSRKEEIRRAGITVEKCPKTDNSGRLIAAILNSVESMICRRQKCEVFGQRANRTGTPSRSNLGQYVPLRT